jgi:hypothetical protein
MRDLINGVTAYRAYRDWKQVLGEMQEPARFVEIIDGLIRELPRLGEVVPLARLLAETYPESAGARVLREMLALADVDLASPRFASDLTRERQEAEARPSA